MIPATLRDRLPSAAAAIALQAGLLALLVLSFEVVRHVAPEEERFITLPPLAQPQLQAAPVVIDARGRTPRRSAAPPLRTPAYAQPGFAAPAPPAAITPPAAPPQQTPRDRATCETNYASLSPAERQRCPPPPAPPVDEATRLLGPPSHVKDEAHWQAEMARKNNPTDLGVAVGPGIGIVIQDPLCKLTAFLLGGLKCGALPSNHLSTDAQFQAALDAYHKRRGGGPKPALASPPKTEDGHEKIRDGGAGADPDAGGAASPPAGSGR
jgi:hypothetical protein